MNKVQCPEGHYYDADMFSVCPMCEKMENISSSMNSKKSKFGKKAKEEPAEKSAPSATPKKQSNGLPRRRTSPSQGNIVTVAVFPSNGENVEKEGNPNNAGILDENGHLILKAENKPVKKQVQESDYITAAEIADTNKKAEEVEPEPEQEPEEEAVIIIEEENPEKNLPKNEDAVQEELPEEPEKAELQEEAPAEELAADEPETAESVQEETPEESVPESVQAEPVEKDSEHKDTAKIAQNPHIVPSEYTAPEGGSKTVGFYHFDIEPVVGWLVCVSGQIKGKSFKLKSGQNVIGASGIMDVYLPSKEKRKGEAQALLIFEPIKKEFILRVTGNEKCTVNSENIESFVTLKNYDKIKIGEYQLIFKALCSDKFDWKNYE